MSYHTEEQAWRAAVQYANQCGRRGMVVESIQVLPPRTAAVTYMLVIGQVRPPTINDPA